MQDTKPCDLLVKAGVLLTQDDARSVIHEAGIAVTDGLIQAVGPYVDLERNYDPAQQLDMSGKLVMPGLINGHTHLPMTYLRGVADDLPLIEWLEQHIWPVEKHLTDEIIEIGARIGCAELIRTGCTAFMNGYFKEHLTGDIASASGLRAVLGEGFFSFPSPHYPTAEDCWRTVEALDERFQDNPNIRSAVTPHAVYTVIPEHLTASYELAERLDLPWQLHLAESPGETATCLDKYGKRPIELVHGLGLLSPRTTLPHCVDVTEEELDILAETGANVVHNPASNLKLESGIAPVQAMLDRGITVGLGTDSASSNNQLNMFREMGLAALVGKVRHNDASAVCAQSALDMATRHSAVAIGWPELGRIEPGCPADMIALDTAAPNLMPMFNPISHVAYATTGTEVCMTMVAGEVLYLYGEFKFMDINSLRKEAVTAANWVRSKAKGM